MPGGVFHCSRNAAREQPGSQHRRAAVLVGPAGVEHLLFESHLFTESSLPDQGRAALAEGDDRGFCRQVEGVAVAPEAGEVGFDEVGVEVEGRGEVVDPVADRAAVWGLVGRIGPAAVGAEDGDHSGLVEKTKVG